MVKVWYGIPAIIYHDLFFVTITTDAKPRLCAVIFLASMYKLSNPAHLFTYTMRGFSIRLRHLAEHNLVKYLLKGVVGRPSLIRLVVYNGEMIVLRTSP